MELEVFVRNALVQVVQGVVSARAEVEDEGARLAPRMEHIFGGKQQNLEAFGWAKGDTGDPVLMVEFDVAVTATEASESKGGIGVLAGAFGAGSHFKSDAGTQNVSRLRFQVPIKYPSDRE